jgi:hypothetical protein
MTTETERMSNPAAAKEPSDLLKEAVDSVNGLPNNVSHQYTYYEHGVEKESG